MKKHIALTAAVLMAGVLNLRAQEPFTLQQCYLKAQEHSPLAAELQKLQEIRHIRNRNLTAGWYPTLDAGGSFVYNTSVVDLSSTLGSLPIPGIADKLEALPHEQYRVTLEVNQMIYDGGAVKCAKAMENADLQVNVKLLDAELYKLRNQVNQYYFNILLLDRQKDLLSAGLHLMEEHIRTAGSASTEGAALKTDVDRLRGEQLRLQQQLRENRINREANLRMLSEITGIPFDTAQTPALPVFEIAGQPDLNRAELQVFDLRKEQLNTSLEMIQSRRMPKAFVFATAGMGNPPGNDFFSNEFAPYAVAGVGIKWNIFDWNKAEHEKRIIMLQKEMLEGRKADLAGTLMRQLEAKRAEIEGLEALLKTDDELIQLRTRIVATTVSQYRNGTITLAEYLKDLHAEQEAWLTYELHRITLAKAKTEYLTIAGQDLFSL